MSEFLDRYPNSRTGERRPHWPPDVRGISLEGLSQLGLDSRGRLYWDGQRLEVQRFELSSGQAIGAFLGIAAAVSVAVFDALRFFGYGVL